MATATIIPTSNLPAVSLDEKAGAIIQESTEEKNPVLITSDYAYHCTNLVKINDEGVKNAARFIRTSLLSTDYTPRTWRTHPLHILPDEPHSPSGPHNKLVLNWIFFISALNFSFWSEKSDEERYAVDWRESWVSQKRKVYTGYWSLVAAINRAMVNDELPITDPAFYASETLCPNSLLEYVFRPAKTSKETIPLLAERIAVLREVGFILCSAFGGSFAGFLDEFHRRHSGQGSALDLVKMVTETFPSFRDEVFYEGQKVYLWKRPQILVAELWAAFYPPSTSTLHPLFPSQNGAQIHQLTMFADYRVPQILHHLRILTYPAPLIALLKAGTMLAPGSREEVSLRAASILGVERIREEINRLRLAGVGEKDEDKGQISSVIIDFYLWDLAKRVEGGEERIEGIDTEGIVPPHRTRSIWY